MGPPCHNRIWHRSPSPHQRDPGEGGTEVILPVDNQEYLGCGREECAKVRGVLLRDGSKDGHWDPVPCRFCWKRISGGELEGQEGSWMGKVSEDPSGSSPQAPAVRLHRTAEVTPTGVGIRAAVHSQHRRVFRPSGVGAGGDFLHGPFPGPGRGGHQGEGSPTCQ